MLKVQLSAACYKVAQVETLADIDATIRRLHPDLIICAHDLPDGSAIDLRSRLNQQSDLATIPILALQSGCSRSSALQVLDAGVDDVLQLPLNDTVLQSRIRALLRNRPRSDEPIPEHVAASVFGMAEAPAVFRSAAPARVALVTGAIKSSAQWCSLLQDRVPYRLRSYTMDDVAALMSEPVPDAVVIGVSQGDESRVFNLVSDLKARSTTRNCAIIAIPDPADAFLTAEALDRGADDVTQFGFCVPELASRLRRQLRLKAQKEKQRDTMRNGLHAATTDFLTKLHNRRYLRFGAERLIRQAIAGDAAVAVLIADLDHFKVVNDTHGHAAGDGVLVETAKRLKSAAPADALVARVGGEEFAIVLPNSSMSRACHVAEHLRRSICETAYALPDGSDTINVTASIGVVTGPLRQDTPQQQIDTLMFEADKALYSAKHTGRNRVEMARLSA